MHFYSQRCDLSAFVLVGLERCVTRYQADVFLPRHKVSRQLIQEIMESPEPPPRPKPVRMKVNRYTFKVMLFNYAGTFFPILKVVYIIMFPLIIYFSMVWYIFLAFIVFHQSNHYSGAEHFLWQSMYCKQKYLMAAPVFFLGCSSHFLKVITNHVWWTNLPALYLLLRLLFHLQYLKPPQVLDLLL